MTEPKNTDTIYVKTRGGNVDFATEHRFSFFPFYGIGNSLQYIAIIGAVAAGSKFGDEKYLAATCFGVGGLLVFLVGKAINGYTRDVEDTLANHYQNTNYKKIVDTTVSELETRLTLRH